MSVETRSNKLLPVFDGYMIAFLALGGLYILMATYARYVSGLWHYAWVLAMVLLTYVGGVAAAWKLGRARISLLSVLLGPLGATVGFLLSLLVGFFMEENWIDFQREDSGVIVLFGIIPASVIGFWVGIWVAVAVARRSKTPKPEQEPNSEVKK